MFLPSLEEEAVTAPAPPTECEACRAHKAVWGNDDCPCDHVGMDRVSKGALWSAVQEKDARIRELVGLLTEVGTIRVWGPGDAPSVELIDWDVKRKAALARSSEVPK